MREIKPLRRLTNAKKFSTRLLILASVIESLRKGKEFDQRFLSMCVIGLGLRLAGQDNHSFVAEWQLFAAFYGVTDSQAFNIYLAHYDALDIGLRRSYSANMEKVTPKQAANVLRRLAAKLKEAGK